MEIKTIGVIGAGQMGGGIAQVAAMSGLDVIMNDIQDEFVQRGMDTITKLLNRGVEKVVVGGMLVKVASKDFISLVSRKESLVVHSKIGTFRPKEIYFSCIDGMTIYCKSKNMLEGMEHVAEAVRIEIPKNMIVDI